MTGQELLAILMAVPLDQEVKFLSSSRRTGLFDIKNVEVRDGHIELQSIETSEILDWDEIKKQNRKDQGRD